MTDRRRAALRATERLNGIDHVEVEDDDGHIDLHVYLIRSLPAGAEPFGLENVVLESEPGPPDVAVEGFFEFRRAPDPARDDYAVIRLDARGAQAGYTVRLAGTVERPIPDIDPRCGAATFTFDAGGPTAVDCRPARPPDDPPGPPPELSHLAKDYASFRALLLDRLATTLPDWPDRHAADPYLTVLEVLAYEADRLSYAQDAIGTEAYLDTARLRTSVRRHVRLVDYPMHEGCNARVWVCLEVDGDPWLAAGDIAFLTRPDGVAPGDVVLRPEQAAREGRHEVFEPLIAPHPGTVLPGEVVDPAGLAERVRNGPEEIFERLRVPMSGPDRDILAGADRAAQLEVLAGALTALVRDPGWGLRSAEAARRVLDRYGTLTAFTGAHVAAHNRAELAGLLPGELAGPDRLRMHEAHNWIALHTWDDSQCRLETGATTATLRDAGEGDERALRHLRPGDVLVLEEVLGPASGNPADADPAHRHAVRLTGIRPGADPVGHVPIVEITWDEADALPFPFVLAATGPAPECAPLSGITVARGNVVPADHGETNGGPERLVDQGREVRAGPFEPPYDVVPSGAIDLCCGPCGSITEVAAADPPYRPVLARSPLVFATPPVAGAPAGAFLRQDPRQTLPALTVYEPALGAGHGAVDRPLGAGVLPYQRWDPRRDLLGSGPAGAHLVAEVDDDQVAHLRFGDGVTGRRPQPGTRMLVTYRVGGGTAGNVGGEAISHAVLRGPIHDGRIRRVRNPMPASGGADPEPVDEVRLRAPHAFRSWLERAVTGEDYAAIVHREFPGRVQRVAAAVAGGAVTVRVDPLSTVRDPAALRAEIAAHLERYRRIGHVVAVAEAQDVPVSVAVAVSPRAGHQPGAVREAVLDRIRALFQPDELTFGQDVAVSRIVAAVAAVPGVAWARVTDLSPVAGDPSVPDGDVLAVAPDAIASLGALSMSLEPVS
jgi:hypothetical protein